MRMKLSIKIPEILLIYGLAQYTRINHPLPLPEDCTDMDAGQRIDRNGYC